MASDHKPNLITINLPKSESIRILTNSIYNNCTTIYNQTRNSWRCKAEAAVAVGVAVAEARGVLAPVDAVPSTEAELHRPEVVIGFA